MVKEDDEPKFRITLIQGGGNSFCEALRNSQNKFDIGIDEVLFTVDGFNEDDEIVEGKQKDED